MPRGPAPAWNRRVQPILDDHVRASVSAANGKHDPETGHYATLKYVGCASRERATEISRALYRCANYLHKHGELPVSMHAKIIKEDDGTYSVEFRAINKTHAQKYMLEKYGTDRSKWPYDPRKRNEK